MNIKAFFPCGGGSNSFLGTGSENQIFSKNSSRCQSFSQIFKKLLLHKQKNHYPPRWISITHIWSPTLFPRGIIIFQGVLTKFKFSMKFPYLEKFTDLMKNLKYEHQSIFSLWWMVKLNFRDRYRKPNIFSKNSSSCQVFSPNSQKMTLWCKKKKTITHPDGFV